MSKYPNPTTPAAALDYLAMVYQHCEGVNSCPADMWIEDDRGWIMLEHTDQGVVEKSRRALTLLGGRARRIRQVTVYRYKSESGGWIITGHKREGIEARSYTVYRMSFKIARRVLLAIQLDIDDPATAA